MWGNFTPIIIGITRNYLHAIRICFFPSFLFHFILDLKENVIFHMVFTWNVKESQSNRKVWNVQSSTTPLNLILGTFLKELLPFELECWNAIKFFFLFFSMKKRLVASNILFLCLILKNLREKDERNTCCEALRQC